MLEHPSIRRYSFVSQPCNTVADMSSENPSGADNQQETGDQELNLDPLWIVGFVDGEGCFSVSVHRNPHVRRTRGWQLQAAFQVYQHVSGVAVLYGLQRFFGCGGLSRKGPTSNVMTYTVWSLQDLEERIIPFFEMNELMVNESTSSASLRS